MRKIIVLLTTVLVLSFCPASWAYEIETGPKVVVNGQEIRPDVAPIIVDGRTMIPARALAEALGTDVSYNQQSNIMNVNWNADMKAHVTLGNLMLSNKDFAADVLKLVDKYFNKSKTSQTTTPPTTTPTTSNQTTTPISQPVQQSQVKPDLSGTIAAMRSLKTQGSMITLNARINNLITELNIHKLHYEPESTFNSMVQGTMFPTSGVTLTLNAKQFNMIATQVLGGILNDDAAISQLQALTTNASTPISTTPYIGSGTSHWISENNDGQTIILEDGSVWEVAPLDVLKSSLWLPSSRVSIVKGNNIMYPYSLINGNNSVQAKRVR